MDAPTDIRPDVWAAFRACRLWRTASDEAVAVLARARAGRRRGARGLACTRGRTRRGVRCARSGQGARLLSGRRRPADHLRDRRGGPAARRRGRHGGSALSGQHRRCDPGDLRVRPDRGALRAVGRTSRRWHARCVADLANARRELHRGRHDAGARCPEPRRPLRLPARAAIGQPHGHGAACQPGHEEGRTRHGSRHHSRIALTSVRAAQGRRSHGGSGQNVTITDMRALAALGSGYEEG